MPDMLKKRNNAPSNQVNCPDSIDGPENARIRKQPSVKLMTCTIIMSTTTDLRKFVMSLIVV